MVTEAQDAATAEVQNKIEDLRHQHRPSETDNSCTCDYPIWSEAHQEIKVRIGLVEYLHEVELEKHDLMRQFRSQDLANCMMTYVTHVMKPDAELDLADLAMWLIENGFHR